MAELILGPMLRHVDRTTATVWVETDASCTVEVHANGVAHRAPTFTVHGHHYALVIVRGLEPDSVTPYQVHLDGVGRWPEPDAGMPESVIRTTVHRRPVRILFGSCRAAAPHEPPYSLERDRDDDARGVDALWAHAIRLLDLPPDEWPDLALFVGDQVYADDTSPRASERIERRRARQEGVVPPELLPPEDVVADFDEYTWLYHEAWSGRIERWFLSVVPTAMIFDDHDVIDDWNISASWVEDIRAEPWWQEHIIGGMVSYWIHQHLGNQSPDQIEAEGMLAALESMDDGTEYLRAWAFESEHFTPVPGGYRFSHARDVGGVRIVVIDARNGRVLEPRRRRMVDADEWAWVTVRALAPCDHLVLVSSVPVFVPPGIHGLQQWNEAVCDGRWGRRAARWAERIRRSLDLEDWSAFDRSFGEMLELLRRVTTDDSAGRRAPATTTVVAGDIHFAYVAGIHLDRGHRGRPPVRQVVSSPMRNALVTTERGVIRFVSGRAGSRLGRLLARLAGRPAPDHRFELEDGPYFNNNIGMLTFGSDTGARVVVEQSRADDERPVLDVVIDRPL